jgi:hypothetical protein
MFMRVPLRESYNELPDLFSCSHASSQGLLRLNWESLPSLLQAARPIDRTLSVEYIQKKAILNCTLQDVMGTAYPGPMVLQLARSRW